MNARKRRATPDVARIRRAAALAAMAASFGAVATAGAPQAVAAEVCEPSPILINSGGTNRLVSYSVDGTQRSVVPVQRSYGDIALTADGNLYGISYPTGTVLYRIDPDTGAETAAVPLTGAITNPAHFSNPASPSLNGLSALPNGHLLVGAATSSTIFEIDPATGNTTVFGAAFPAGITSAGDFLTLPDGDVLAIGSDGTDSPIFRIRPDMTITRVGTVPRTFGAAQSAGKIYLATATGDLLRLDAVPTASSTAVPDHTVVTRTAISFYGATSAGDSGRCAALETRKTVDAGSGTTLQPGQTVTYTLTFDNSKGTADADVAYVDDLTRLVDDAAITAGPALASGEGLTVSPPATQNGVTSFTVKGVLPAGKTATVTYSATVNSPVTGDRVADNFLLPEGATRPASCDAASGLCTTNPVAAPEATPPAPRPNLTLNMTVNRVTVVAGQTVVFRLVGRNTGRGTARSVVLCDTLPAGTTLAGRRPAGARVARGQVCWTLGTMRPGQRVTRTVRVRINRDIRARRIVNRATLDRTNVRGVDARAQRAVRVISVSPRVVVSRVTG